jgi:hypothetical protein
MDDSIELGELLQVGNGARGFWPRFVWQEVALVEIRG